MKWGAPEAAFTPDALKAWYPTARSDQNMLTTYEFSGPRDPPPRLPMPVWAVHASGDQAVALTVTAKWGLLARSDEEFEMLEIPSFPHLFHKEEEARQQAMDFLLELASDKLGLFKGRRVT